MIQLKNNYYRKVNETEKKITDNNHENYITTEELNKLTAVNVTGRLAQANLVGKNNIADVRKKDRL